MTQKHRCIAPPHDAMEKALFLAHQMIAETSKALAQAVDA